MTPFQLKRLDYFKKAATNHDWIRLGPGDVELFEECITNEILRVAEKVMENHKELFQDLAELERREKQMDATQAAALNTAFDKSLQKEPKRERNND